MCTGTKTALVSIVAAFKKHMQENAAEGKNRINKAACMCGKDSNTLQMFKFHFKSGLFQLKKKSVPNQLQ